MEQHFVISVNKRHTIVPAVDCTLEGDDLLYAGTYWECVGYILTIAITTHKQKQLNHSS